MTEIHVYVCSHVFADVRPILLVVRESGDWMFLCGDVHEENEDYHLVGVNHLTDRDPTLRNLPDLPDNTEAERTEVGGEWHIAPLDSQ